MRRLLFVLVVFTACNNNAEFKKYYMDTTVSPYVEPAEIPKPENWSYSEAKDEMTEKVRYFAQCNSVNLVNFDFPYEGGSRLTLMIRKMNGKNEVILQISKGQFMSSYNSVVTIKYDDEQPKTYYFNEAADGSSDYIFLNNAASIINKLKQSKKVKIQPSFYQAGQIVFEFNTGGLNWEHLKGN